MAAGEVKGGFRGHPEPRQRTAFSALLLFGVSAAEREKEVFGDTPHPAEDAVLCTSAL